MLASQAGKLCRPSFLSALTFPSHSALFQSFIRFICFAFLIFLFCTAPAQAGEVRLTEKGFLIDAGAAGTYTLGYPRLVTQEDKATFFTNVTVKADGSSAVLTYLPSGQLTIERQPDGTWLYQASEMPPEITKFIFSTSFPTSIIEAGATWAFNDENFKPFPSTKGEARVAFGNPKTFSLRMKGGGFTISYIDKTFNTLTDYRVHKKETFGLGLVVYFPNIKDGKKTYHLKIDILPEVTPAPSPAKES